MRRVFHDELESLREGLVSMGEQVATAIKDATSALLNADIELADQVIANDEAIDSLQQELDEQSVRMLARQAPVAGDLRVVVSALRMSASLERMGDLARHVALTTRRRYPNYVIPAELVPTFSQMGKLAQDMAGQMTSLLEERDLEVADRISTLDDHLDSLHRDVFDVLFSPDWDESVAETVDVTLVGRFYERFGDHACSVAKRVVFLVTGE